LLLNDGYSAGMCMYTIQTRVCVTRDTNCGWIAVKQHRRPKVSADVCLCCTTLLGKMKLHPHSNVVSILSLHRCGTMCMEYAAGGSLEGNKLQEETVCLVLRDVFAGLAYLHGYGVIHTDIKPANIVRKHMQQNCRDEDNEYMICDFILCGQSSKECVYKAHTTHNHQKTPPGTPGYMAPEVVRGGVPCEKSDTWNVGCTALSLCTGADPWESEESNLSVMYKIGLDTRPPYSLTVMSTLMESVVCKLLTICTLDRRSPSSIYSHMQRQTPQTASLLSVLATCLYEL